MPTLPAITTAQAPLRPALPTGSQPTPTPADPYADLFTPSSVPLLVELAKSKIHVQAGYMHLTDSLQAGVTLAGPLVGGPLELLQEGNTVHAVGPGGEELRARPLSGDEEGLQVELPGKRTLTVSQTRDTQSYRLAIANDKVKVEALFGRDGNFEHASATTLAPGPGHFSSEIDLNRDSDHLSVSSFRDGDLRGAAWPLNGLKFDPPGRPDLAEVAAWKAGVTDVLGELQVDLACAPTENARPPAPRRDPFATLFQPDTAPQLQSLAADTKLSRGSERELLDALKTGITITAGILGGAVGSSLTLQTREDQLTATLSCGESRRELEATLEQGRWPSVKLPDGRFLGLRQGPELDLTVKAWDGHEVEVQFDRDNRVTSVNASVGGKSVSLNLRGEHPFLRLEKEENHRKTASPTELKTEGSALDRPQPPPSLTEMAQAKDSVLARLARGAAPPPWMKRHS